jgi:hypothetical protein
MQGWVWRGFKCNRNNKQGGSGQWPMRNGGRLYWKPGYTTECSAWEKVEEEKEEEESFPLNLYILENSLY